MNILLARLLSVAVFALIVAHPAGAELVISEIMYRPGSTFPENVAREFIELHNPTAAPVAIGGWALTSGVAFTIPAGTMIAAGGYLVIAANPAAVQSGYGITGVLGPWVAGATLSNNSEKIELSKPGVTAGSWIIVDEVTYATEGDWATRVRELNFDGWDWLTPANGGDKSMELRNAALSNDNGQNWTPSTALAGATPGAANSTQSTNVAPIIEEVKHTPAVPKAADSVTISCNVTDEAIAGVSVSLHWRDASSISPGAFQVVPMVSNGNRRFSAVLGPKATLTIVEFYVSATDGVNTRTWPAATSEGQNANCQYQVDNAASNNVDSFYRLILTAAENSAFDGVNNSSDRQFNQTLVVTRGAETTIRYRSSMRIRGNSSRSYQFRPLRISVPNDQRWEGITDFNLNPRSSYLQYLGMRLFQAAGLPASDAIPVELRRNGVEYTVSTNSTPDYGKWVRMEELNADTVDNHWPNAAGGNIYKKGRPDQYWRATQPAPPDPNFELDGWSKQNNSAANDWSDLRGFFQTWQTAGAPHFPGAPANNFANGDGGAKNDIGMWNGTAFTGAEVTLLETVSDLDQWARYLAVMTILMDNETNISNGQDDDYSVYFVPSAGGQRRMQLLPHDLDTIFGLGDTPQPFNFRGLYDATAEGSIFRPLLPLLGNDPTSGNAAFRTKYVTALLELFGGIFNASTAGNPNPSLYQFLDNHLSGWVPAARITAIKTFATQRQNHLLDLIPDGVVGGGVATPIAPTAGTSTSILISEPGALMIHEVLAKNVSAMNVGEAFPDIIELRNTGANAVDLGGMSLTDDPAIKDKYVFPGGTTIAANGYLIVYADLTIGSPHTGFGLSEDGETLQLYASVAAGQTLLDSITFGAQPADYSIGRTGTALNTWTLCTPTIGAANNAVQALASPDGVRINEWLGNTDYQFDQDFLELYNPAPQPVPIGGMAVTDDFINYPARRILPALSFIGPSSFLRMDAKGSDALPESGTDLPFRIGATFGWLALVGQNGALVDRVDVISQTADTSTGRAPDGNSILSRFGLPTHVITPGASNVAPPANVLALMNGLRVTELLYHPSNLEFIELQNIGATALDLSGVRFTRGIAYTFAPGVTLAPGALIAICRDRAAFQTQFGPAVPLAEGNFTGTLDNAGEFVALRPAEPWNVNILNFEYESDWFPETDTGFSLVVRDAPATFPGDWDQRITWLPSSALYGSPGDAGPPAISSALAASGAIGETFQYQITATQFPTSFNASPLPNGLTINLTTGLITGTPTEAGTFTVQITATNLRGSDTKPLVLQISSSGPFAGFAWNNIASPQHTGAPFSATLRAVDAQGRTVLTFNGTANLSSASAGTTSIGTGTSSWNFPLSTFYEDARTQSIYLASEIGTAGTITSLALDVTSPPGQVMNNWRIRMKHTTLAGYTTNSWEGSTSGWTTVYQQNERISTTGTVTFTFATPFAYDGVRNLMIDFSYNNSSYTSDGEVRYTSTPNNRTLHYRTDSGFGDPLNWSGTGSPTIPPPNVSARIPNIKLVTGPTVSVTPSVTGAFVNGVWTGLLTVDQSAVGVRLRASDTAGHTAVSNPFDTTNAPPPVITSPAAITAVVNQPCSYQILASNLPTSYNASSLPAGLTVDLTSGLISGTPSAPGPASATVSATNVSGTGNAPLAIDVQADADQDGVGDAWETANGLNPGDPSDANTDLDGDGQSNRAEWIAGTSASDANLQFAIVSQQSIGADVHVVWRSVVGKRYRFLTRTDLATGTWTDLTPNPVVATGVTSEFTHAGGMIGPARYYRVEIAP